MNKTNIDYLTHSWNPIAMRCTPISEACEHCWHLRMANRLGANYKIPHDVRLAYHGNAPPFLMDSRLNEPLRRKKPAIIGVQFMGDLFHKQVTYEQRVEIFQVIAEASWHTVLILTKRPKDMFDFIQSIEDWEWYHFQHVWWGVSCENQQRADERIPILLDIPAAKRFVSLEPMLAPMNLTPYISKLTVGHRDKYNTKTLYDQYPVLDWVIAGCESGPNRRQAKTQWFRDLKNQCVDADIPFFLKQANGYINGKSTVVKLPELDSKIWNERP